MNALLDWLDHRTGIRALVHEALYEKIPGGARWQYVWGSTLVFTFFVQIVTGLVLWMGYSPSTRTAWESVFYIQHEMTLGWLVRGIHHFAAQAMVILMVVHLVQVIVCGAYKAPREVNFWLGLVLMQIVMGLGLTGYLLPWDQKGYYATQVATEIMGSTPVVGPQLQQFMQGGTNYGHHTLTRFFALHAGVLPAALVMFLALHIYVFRRHGITAAEPIRKPTGMFWPEQVLMDSVACLGVLGGVLILAIWKGAELSAPANPGEPFSAARPEWYYLFLFRFLKFGWVSKLGKITHLGEAFGAVVIPGALMTFLVLMPLIARYRAGHKLNLAFLWTVIAGATGLTGLALFEDWWSSAKSGVEFREAVAQAQHDGERATELARRPTGIPPEGAIALMRNDPFTQGPRLFKNYCADCHRPQDTASTDKSRPPVAPVLATARQTQFGSRTWIRSALTDFGGHFAALKNAEAAKLPQPSQVSASEILNGNMAKWSTTNAPLLNDAANQEAVNSLIEFLYSQSGRPDAKSQDDAQVVAGREVFLSGKLPTGAFDSACKDCHTLRLRGESKSLADGGLPDLTHYGGAEWLKRFVAHPETTYGEHNLMPAFAEQLTPRDLDLLTRWLAGEGE